MAQIMVLLGLVCNVILGLAIGHTNFIFGTVTLLIKLAMSVHTKPDSEGHYSYDALQEEILKDLPSSLYTAMQRLNLDGKTILYAACPSCHHIHAPSLSTNNTPTWPKECENEIVGVDGRSKCATGLLVVTKSHPRPIKPFLTHSFVDYLARLLSTPEIEIEMDQACDEALAWKKQGGEDVVDNVLHGTFIQEFVGPDGNLFIDRGKDKRMRIIFGYSVDYFPPHGSRKRSSSASIGVLSIYPLNISIRTRHKPEHVFVQILTGPNTPHQEFLNPYLRPMVDIGVIGWERGIRLSKTGATPQTGRVVDIAFVLSVNDLPAARDMIGAAQHGSHILCTICDCRGRKHAYRTDCEQWKLRDVAHMRAQAEAWRDAKTSAERAKIYAEDGLRWTELWRLPYWNPTLMVTPEPMHCLYEGLVAFHSRGVLQLNATDAAKPQEPPPAYSFDFLEYDPESPKAPPKCRVTCLKEEKQITAIHRLLVRPFTDQGNDSDDNGSDDDDDAAAGSVEEFTSETLLKRMTTRNKAALRFVCWSLGLRGTGDSELTHEDNLVRLAKDDLTNLLLSWVSRLSESIVLPLTYMPLAFEPTPHESQLLPPPKDDFHGRLALRSRSRCEDRHSCVGTSCPQKFRREGSGFNQGG